MRRALILLFLAFPAFSAEDAIPPLALFALPRAELKPSAPTPTPFMDPGPGVAASTNSVAEPAVEDFSLTKETAPAVSEASVQSFESMNGGAVLSAIERPVELGGAAGWLNQNVWDPVFAPEVIKVGKVKITGGVVAAIKRKNPFCLLHPLVFAAGW